jgi:hypothetical protein
VTTVSTPSSPALATSAAEAMPQSTVMISLVPSVASRSTVAMESP